MVVWIPVLQNFCKTGLLFCRIAIWCGNRGKDRVHRPNDKVKRDTKRNLRTYSNPTAALIQIEHPKKCMKNRYRNINQRAIPKGWPFLFAHFGWFTRYEIILAQQYIAMQGKFWRNDFYRLHFGNKSIIIRVIPAGRILQCPEMEFQQIMINPLIQEIWWLKSMSSSGYSLWRSK